MTAGLPLMKCVLLLLAGSVLLPFGLLTVMLVTDAAIQKKIHGSRITALIFSNEEMEDIIKIFKSLEEIGLVIKEIIETIKNEGKKKKGGFLPMILAASLLGSALAGNRVIRAGEEVIRAEQDF